MLSREGMSISKPRLKDYSNEQFLYLTTTGRKTGLSREIEIWFVERDGRLYVLAEYGYRAHWVQNVLANCSVTVRLSGTRCKAVGRVLDSQHDVELYTEVRALVRDKYGWGGRSAT